MHLKYFTCALNYFQIRSCLKFGQRYCHSHVSENKVSYELPKCMSAWQVTSYSKEERLQLSNNVEVPIIIDPYQVLVKVTAASVNPLDIEMMRWCHYSLN